MVYDLGPVKAHVRAAAESIGPRFGITVVYGWRAVDAFPDHPSGLALDYMTSNLGVGAAIAQYHIDNSQALAVDYIIHNRRSWNSKRRTWVAYGGSNPHIDHVHVTYFATAGSGLAGATPLGFGDVTTTPLAFGSETLNKLNDLFAMLTESNTWLRVGMFIGGVLFIAIGVMGASGVTSAVGKVIKGG